MRIVWMFLRAMRCYKFVCTALLGAPLLPKVVVRDCYPRAEFPKPVHF
jgi:hypothetical protein